MVGTVIPPYPIPETRQPGNHACLFARSGEAKGADKPRQQYHNYMRDPVRQEQERGDKITYMLHLIDKGRDGIRLRVGNWRVIMEDGVILAVLEIGARGSVYD